MCSSLLCNPWICNLSHIDVIPRFRPGEYITSVLGVTCSEPVSPTAKTSSLEETREKKVTRLRKRITTMKFELRTMTDDESLIDFSGFCFLDEEIVRK
jgi:hypothetical protein